MTSTHAMLEQVATVAEHLRQGIRERPVAGEWDVAAIREHLARYRFDAPVTDAALIDDVAGMLARWTIQVTSPRYFGLFNPSVLPITVAADALVAVYNPQLAAWGHAPAANEIERHVLAFLASRLGFAGDRAIGSFTSGGQEANLSATLVALTHAFPRLARDGLRSLDGDPVFYVSEHGHHSFHKVAHACGLGRDALRAVPVDAAGRMQPDACQALIAGDRARSRLPFMVVGTAGTTGTGAIDPLPALAETCRRERLWFHVDAAWGGSVALSDRLRPLVDGIECADSVTWDAHKWLSVPVGAGMVFYRHGEAAAETFAPGDAGYVPRNVHGTPDPYATSLQWSRRFIGLKLFMALAVNGVAGYGRIIEGQVALAERLRSSLIATGWEVVSRSPLAVVCATHPSLRGDENAVEALVAAVNRRGRAWVSCLPWPPHGTLVRACVTSYQAEAADLDTLVGELEQAREQVA